MLINLFSKPIYKNHREKLLCSLDLFIVLISYAVAYWAKNNFDLPQFTKFSFIKLLVVLCTISIVYAISFISFRIHKSLWKYISTTETFRIALSVITAGIICVILSVLTKSNSEYPAVIFIATLLITLIMFSIRIFYRMLRKNMGMSVTDKKAIIIGAGDTGYLVYKELTQNNDLGYKVVGFLDDLRVGNYVSGVKVIGTTHEIASLYNKGKFDAVFIAMSTASKSVINRIVDTCQDLCIETKIMKISSDNIDDVDNAKRIKDVSIEDLLGRGEVKLQQDEISSYIKGKKILVTGAAGSIGSELCRQILKYSPSQLSLVDINENSLYMLEQEFLRMSKHDKLDNNIDIITYITSIRDKAALSDLFSSIKPDVVYHAAAHKHVPLMETRPKEAIKNNVFGTKNVIECCIENEVSRFIMISTDKAVNPTNVMGATKRMTEMIMQAYGDNKVTKMAAVRFGNVLGSNGSVIPIFKKQIEEGGPVTITHKNITRFFMTIPEASQLVLQAGFYADKGEIFVLDMGQPVRIVDLAEKLIRLSGFRPYADMDIVEIGLRPGEKMYEELSLGHESTSRTKNDLIFVNEVVSIKKSDLNKKLKVLLKVISEDNCNDDIKDVLMKQIDND